MVHQFAIAARREDWSSLEDIEPPLKQRPLSQTIDHAIYDEIYAIAPDLRSQALVLSTSNLHAGDWLRALPSSTLGLHIPDSEFRLSPVLVGLADVRGSPVCTSPMDTFGDHAIGFGGNSDRIFQHNAIRDVLFSAAQCH